MSRIAAFVGKTLPDLLLIPVPTLLVVGLGYALGARIATRLLGVVDVLGIVFVFSVWFVAVSYVVGIAIGSSRVTGVATNLVQFPLLFASTAFRRARCRGGLDR